MRCTANAEARKVAHKADNETLLAGLVYCAHCGAKMSGFMHHDRYKLRDGTVKEALKPKYNCYQRAQKLRNCDGQALYLADRVDGIVLEVVRELLSSIRRAPRDKLLEQKIRQEYQDKRKQRAKLEKGCRTANMHWIDMKRKCCGALTEKAVFRRKCWPG